MNLRQTEEKLKVSQLNVISKTSSSVANPNLSSNQKSELSFQGVQCINEFKLNPVDIHLLGVGGANVNNFLNTHGSNS